jgi:hypothetical protein
VRRGEGGESSVPWMPAAAGRASEEREGARSRRRGGRMPGTDGCGGGAALIGKEGRRIWGRREAEGRGGCAAAVEGGRVRGAGVRVEDACYIRNESD